MLSRRWIAGGALALLSGAVAMACGPFFPWQLLDDRALTLKVTPVNSFAFEAMHLVSAPKSKLKPVENFDYAWASQSGDRQAENAARDLGEAETAGLSINQIILLRAARAAASGPDALEKGKGLPLSILHYTAGAIAWHKSDLVFAKSQFEAVLRLTEKDRKPRLVWATFMLGRIAAEAHDEPEIASKFSWTRGAAEGGAPDPLGLAVASYGEEAREHLHAAEALLEAGGATVSTPSASQPGTNSEAAKYAGSVLPTRQEKPFRLEIAQAIALYSSQAAHGSDRAVQSLRLVAEFLLDSPDRIAAVANEPLAQRLMVAYALRLTASNTTDIRKLGYNDVTFNTASSQNRRQDLLAALANALQQQPHPAGADRIAALCYDQGNWRCASDFANKSGSSLASWVKAKLATQKGDLTEAAKFYAAAARGFPATDNLEEDNKKAILGERSVVALARGEYLDALDKLMPVSGTYWPDVAYIAERVLTTGELKTYVDAHVPAVLVAKPVASPGYAENFNAHTALRDLLARRLMRDGRFAEALTYFSNLKTRDSAKAYAAALTTAARSWGRVDKAQALFAAATLARQSGMEMMGTEGPPDLFYTSGDFGAGIGRTTLSGDLITPSEKQRFATSNAQPDQRFHYRYLAVEEASRAADLLPAKSQAFAAVLCHATAWSSLDRARAKALWQRYVKEGARVSFAKSFGRKCPAPDFQNAVRLERKAMLRTVRRFVSHHRWWIAGSAALLLASALGIFVWRRRHVGPK